jgi:DNA (cytosine-5)-methyltransferase 1
VHELALFAGAGGGILGGHLLGWRTVCAVERERYAADVLVARQNDGSLPPFPVWDDVCTFDGRPWRGAVGVVSGGFPCQDISLAGNGAGIDGARSGLWGHMARIVGEVRPRFAFVENSPALTTRGLGRVLGDLAELGFDAEWCVLGADDVGAHHRRKRIWILAHASSDAMDVKQGRGRGSSGSRAALARWDGDPGDLADADRERQRSGRREVRARQPRPMADPDSRRCECERRGGLLDGQRKALGHHPHGCGCGLSPERPAWPAEPDVGRVAHGVAARVDRLRATGNGQVPRVAAAAFELLRARGGW